MPDTTADAAQAATDASTVGQAPTTTTSTEPQAGESPEDYKRMIAELRKENASHRTKLKTFEEAQAAAELAKLGDLEKAQKQAEQAQKQLETYKQELVNAQVKLAAKDKGIIDPDIAALALKDKLEYGDDGMPSNLEKALDDLIKAKPYLLAQAQSAAQTASTQRAPTTPANNPGRSSIVQPGGSTMQPGKVTTWHDVYSQNRNK